MVRTFSGAERGAGAKSAWQSSGSSGQGHMAIVRVDPPASVTIAVDFEKPFVAHNINEFTLAPAANGTAVTWSMHGTNPFLAKVMSVFINMDTMMGKHFESGLANLKAVAER